jgi:hypothetical protein
MTQPLMVQSDSAGAAAGARWIRVLSSGARVALQEAGQANRESAGYRAELDRSQQVIAQAQRHRHDCQGGIGGTGSGKY